MPLLIAGEHATLASLRQQYHRTVIKQVEFSRAGFCVSFEVQPDTPVALPQDFAGGHALIRLKDARLGAGCVLFVRNGRLSTLEGYTYDDEWPESTDVLSVDDVKPIKPNTTFYERPNYGRILKVAWTEYPRNEGSKWGSKILLDLVCRCQARCLVIDLLGFHASFGAPLFSSLVTGAAAMLKMGSGGKIRILAVGRTAAKLNYCLHVSMMDSLFGGAAYSSLEDALGNPGSEESLSDR